MFFSNLQKDIEFIEQDINTVTGQGSQVQEIFSKNILGTENEENVTDYLEALEQIGKVIDNLEKRIDEIIEFENGTEFEKVIVNAHFIMEGEAHFEELEIENINASPATALLEDIVR